MTGTGNWNVHGTTALAYRSEPNRERQAAIIDFEIARRSYEARQRLALRRQAQESGLQERAHKNSHITLQDMMIESYQPKRNMSQTLRETISRLGEAISNHPFTSQLRNGSLRGRRWSRASNRQVFTSGALFTALAAALIVIGI